ncbi:DUF6114 domain-containing protein [Actinoplanes siamensis]|uniref:Uncharacterized protein n=1 Tax=Actinoplanes siamensis TaxID=1223317 RepID=A0A919NBM6_9ACTN|nr:DUF6114 domain-containing protein [Actinoplanes siamensis]GIF07953.1 hypothetical protein Asi03nite_54910 [Actinoplanes siamensis]
MSTDDFWSRFRRWRRTRPFWGGLFLLLSGLEFFWSSNMDLANIQIHIGPQGFLSYLLPILMLICGALVWLTPAQRVFYGIIGLLAALYSFIGLNLGGWFIGMFLGIVGGALALAWTMPQARPGLRPPGPLDASGPDNSADGPADPTEPIEIAGHDDRPAAVRAPVVSDSSILPGFEEPRTEPPGPARSGPGETRSELPGRGVNRKALAIIVVPAVLGATVLIGSRLPASADDCPEGLPSIKTTSSASPARKSSPATPATTKPGAKATTTAPAASTATSAPASPNPSPKADEPNPVLDGLHNVVDGVGNLLGIGDDEESPAPSESPSASATGPAAAEPTATRTTAPATAPAGGGKTTRATSAPAEASSAAATGDVIPCLGARQEGLVADGAVPKSAIKPGIMKVDSLTMYNSTYEGVADVPTQNGVLKSLQFNMEKAVNRPFSLTIDEPGDAVTTIRSSVLTTTGNVRFYTPKMTGNLFGVIPVTFTPEQPPPLTLPILWFTNVTIDLAFVSCDTLTAEPLQVVES